MTLLIIGIVVGMVLMRPMLRGLRWVVLTIWAWQAYRLPKDHDPKNLGYKL